MIVTLALALGLLRTPTNDDWAGRYTSYENFASTAIKLTLTGNTYRISGVRMQNSEVAQTIAGRFDPAKNVIRGKFLFRPSGRSTFVGSWSQSRACFEITEDEGDALIGYCLSKE